MSTGSPNKKKKAKEKKEKIPSADYVTEIHGTFIKSSSYF